MSAAQRPASTAGREGLLGCGRRVDTSANPRIPVVMRLVGDLSRATEPHEVLRVFAQRGQDLYGPRAYLSIATRGLAPGEYKITGLIRLDGTEELTTADPWLELNDFPVHRGGFFGQLIRSAEPVLFHHLRLRNDPVVGNTLAAYGSLMAVPVLEDGKPLNWAVYLREDPEGFGMEDLEQAILRANLVGTTVKSVLIAKDLREAHAHIRAEVERIARIQRALLPEAIPRIPGLSIAASYETSDTAGGDYYDLRPLRYGPDGQDADPDGPWGILIADASGHGPSAAVVMAMLHSILHAFPKTPEGPGEMLEHANYHLCAKRIESSFVTAFLGIYDPASRRLSYARAGHTPPLIRNPGPGGCVSRLDAVGAIPLGVLEDTTYEEASISLEPAQTIVLYTDGITEAVSPDGTMFGERGLVRALQRCAGDPKSVLRAIIDPLVRHARGTRPGDDQTLVAIRVDPEG